MGRRRGKGEEKGEKIGEEKGEKRREGEGEERGFLSAEKRIKIGKIDLGGSKMRP